MSEAGYVKHIVPDYMVNKWQQTVDIMAKVFDVPAGLIMRVSESEIEVLVSSRTENNPYKVGESETLGIGLYCETVMSERDILIVPDALEDEDWKDNPDIKLNMLMYMGVPLEWPDGDVFGTICVLDSEKRQYSNPYVELIWEFKKIIESDIKSWVYQQELIDARNRADDANRAKGVFLASMSHELRTPLNAIMGYAQLMQKDADRDFINDAVKTILESSKHLLTLINDVLDMSKIEAGKFRLYDEEFRPDSMLRTIVNILRPKAEHKKLNIEYRMLTPLPWIIKADEKRLRQVLINLLSNAVKFTIEGSVQLTVWYSGIDTESGKGCFFFSVKDTGKGIPLEDIEKIMLPFEQSGDENEYVDGTGLGLPVSKKIIELMGGELQVETKPDKGSHFWFEVKLDVVNHNHDDDFGKKEIFTGYEGDSKVVIWIPGKWNFRDPVAYRLKSMGFIVEEFSEPEEAIDNIAKLKPDAVIVDNLWFSEFNRISSQDIAEIPVIPVEIWSGENGTDLLTNELWSCYQAVKPENLPAVLMNRLGIELKIEKSFKKEVVAKDMIYPAATELRILKQFAEYYKYDDIADELLRIQATDSVYDEFVDEIRGLAAKFRMDDIIQVIDEGLKGEDGN